MTAIYLISVVISRCCFTSGLFQLMEPMRPGWNDQGFGGPCPKFRPDMKSLLIWKVNERWNFVASSFGWHAENQPVRICNVDNSQAEPLVSWLKTGLNLPALVWRKHSKEHTPVLFEWLVVSSCRFLGTDQRLERGDSRWWSVPSAVAFSRIFSRPAGRLSFGQWLNLVVLPSGND